MPTEKENKKQQLRTILSNMSDKEKAKELLKAIETK